MADVKKALSAALRNSKANLGVQFAIEKMQIALKTGTVNASKVVRRATKQLEDLMKRDAEAKRLKVDLLSAYDDVAKLYNEELSKATMETLEKSAYDSQTRLLKFATPEQIGVIKEWAKEQANVTLAEIMGIRDILVAKKVKIVHTEIEKEGDKVVEATRKLIKEEDEQKAKERQQAQAQNRGPVTRTGKAVVG